MQHQAQHQAQHQHSICNSILLIVFFKQYILIIDRDFKKSLILLSFKVVSLIGIQEMRTGFLLLRGGAGEICPGSGGISPWGFFKAEV